MESGDEDDLAMASRDFHRMEETIYKTGYRDGASEATSKHQQETFNMGLQWGLTNGIKLGKLLGLIEFLMDKGVDKTLKSLYDKVEAFATSANGKIPTNDGFNEMDMSDEKSIGIEQELITFSQELKYLSPENISIIDKIMKFKTESEILKQEESVKKSSSTVTNLSW